MAESGKKDLLDELKSMKERMDHLFVLNFNQGDKEKPQDSKEWVPMVDVVDSGNELVYSIDLPGVAEQDIQVECKADRLWISGMRKNDLPQGEALRIERPEGSFSKVFKFLCPVHENRIRAEFKRGVLTVRVPKNSAGRRVRKIEVQPVE